MKHNLDKEDDVFAWLLVLRIVKSLENLCTDKAMIFWITGFEIDIIPCGTKYYFLTLERNLKITEGRSMEI